MSAQHATPSNLPVPALPRLPIRGDVRSLTSPSRRLMPVVRASMAVAAVGLAAEYGLRMLANRALRALVGTSTAVPLATPARASDLIRTVVTEVVVREHFGGQRSRRGR